MVEIDGEGALVLDWHRLSGDEITERLDWLRRSAEPGEDWGYCAELLTCVLKNPETSMLYRLRWFESGQQRTTDKPAMLKNPREAIHDVFGEN